MGANRDLAEAATSRAARDRHPVTAGDRAPDPLPVMSADRFVTAARLAFTAMAWLFVACLIVQLFLVGLDLFEVIGADSRVHREFAYVYGWIAPLLVLLAAAARMPRGRQLVAILLLVLFAMQTYLPSLAERASLVAAFHAVNALAVFWVALHLARHATDPVEPQHSYGGS